MFANHRFMTGAQAALQRERHNILRFSLGPKTVYLVAGQENVRAVFGRDLVHDVTNQEQMTRYALPTLYMMDPAGVRRWEADRSGVTKTPIPEHRQHLGARPLRRHSVLDHNLIWPPPHRAQPRLRRPSVGV